MALLKHPSHPGEILNELYLEPLGLSAIALAKRLHVARTRIERLLKGETSLTADTAIRLSKFFGTIEECWMNLQRGWELARAREIIDVSDITPLEAAQQDAAPHLGALRPSLGTLVVGATWYYCCGMIRRLS